VGADKAYDVAGLVSVFRELNVTPHVIQHMKEPIQRHRRENHATSRIWHQSRKTLAGGKGFRMAETNRTVAQDPRTVRLGASKGRRCIMFRDPLKRSEERTSAQLLLKTGFKRNSPLK
jgi:hypothetical protein